MDETQRKEAQKIAKILVEGILEDSDEAEISPVIDVEFKDESKTVLDNTAFWLENNDETEQRQ